MVKNSNKRQNAILLLILSIICLSILLLLTIALFYEYYHQLPKHFYPYAILYFSIGLIIIYSFIHDFKKSIKKQFFTQLVYAATLFISLLISLALYQKTVIVKVIFPASPFNTKELITLDHQINDYYLVGVYDRHETSLLGKLFILLDPYYALVDEDDSLLSNSEKALIGSLQKEMSINQALIAAHLMAQAELEYELNGFHIVSCAPYASDEFSIGDLITSIDGINFKSEDEFNHLFTLAKERGKLSFGVITKDNEPKAINAAFMGPNQLLGIGLLPSYAILTTTNLTTNHHASAGPSGGLMMSIAIYDSLIEDGLPNNYLIGGTGTINTNGEVGEIGGITQKTIASANAGFDYFLIPKGGSNEEEARKVLGRLNSKMQIIAVSNLEEAVFFLVGLA